MTIKPTELMSILNASLIEMRKYPNDYDKTIKKARELFRWVWSIDWDEPDKDTILIDELPF